MIELHVEDFRSVKYFYRQLGMRIEWERPPEGFKGYLVLRDYYNLLCFWGGNQSVYDHPYFKKFDRSQPRGLGVELVMLTDDLDKLYEIAQNLGCVVEKMTLQPWGLKDFRIVDPAGYYSRWTTPHNILDPNNAVP
jgi:lactoylglutathione lyase